MGKEIWQGWTIEAILKFSYNKEINTAVAGEECELNNLTIFSVSSSENTFRYSQPEPN